MSRRQGPCRPTGPGRFVVVAPFFMLVVVAMALAALPRAAQAADVGADAFIRRGVKLLERRDYQGALGQFRSAHDLLPTPPVVARIGLAEQGLARWPEAEGHLEDALRSESDAWVNQNRRVLEKSLDSVRAHLGTLEVGGSPRGALVKVDGEIKGVLPLPRPLRLETGERRVEVTADGHRSLRKSVTLRAGDRVGVVANLESDEPAPAPGFATGTAAAAGSARAAAPTAPATSDVETGPGWWRAAAWTSLVVGAVVAAAGAYVLFRQPYTTTSDLPLGVAGMGVGVGGAALGVGMLSSGGEAARAAPPPAMGLALRGRF